MRNPFRLLLFFWLSLLAVSGYSHDQFVTDPDLNPGNLVPETIEYLRSDRQLTLVEVEGVDQGDGVDGGDREDRQSDSAQQQAHSISENRWRSIAAQDANFGFDLGYYWFRYPIRTPDGADENWLLEVGYPLLDHLTVYLVQNQRVIQQYNSGDRQPFDLRPEAYPNFLFPFQLKPRQQYWLYVELQTSSSVQAPMSLRSKADFWKTHLTEKIFLIIFYAVLISMFIYNGILYLMVRDQSYLYYILYLGSFIFLMASMDGLAYQYLWPGSTEFHQVSVLLFMNAVLLTAPLFGCSFLRLIDNNPILYRIMATLSWLGVMGMIGAFMLPYGFVVKTTSIVAVATVFIMLYVSVAVLIQRNSREVVIFLTAWATLMMGYVVYVSQKLGWMPINSFTEHAIEVGAIFEVLLLALSLADRINSERKAHLVTQNRMLELQVQANIELDQKVKERTEALEQLNVRLKEVSVTDSLTGVKNRRFFDTQLASEFQKACIGNKWLSLLMIDVDHFKAFNDQHGHQAGDLVLRKVAETITAEVRGEGDLVCRYGGEEFCVLLVNTDAGQAAEIAERIRTAVASRQASWQRQVLTVTASLGCCSIIPDTVHGAEALLKAADENLYRAKEAGRNRVVSSVID